MDLHPQMLKAVGLMAGVSFADLTPGEARAVLREKVARLNQPPAPLRRVMDLYPAGPAGGPLPLRVYVPLTAPDPQAGEGGGEGGGLLPAVVYFHGGGWTIGSHDTVEPQCRYLANAARAIVVSVEYRLAPEHKFPAAVEDCQWAVRWVQGHAHELGADPARLAVAGDSAGGNLAAVTAQQLKRNGGPALAAQVLICPITSVLFDTPSYAENEHGPVLTRRMQERWRENYLADPDDDALRRDPRVSPLLAADGDFAGLPPASVITASHDPLRDEGIAYAERLAAAGVAVRARNWDGYTHLFPSMGGVVDAAFEALDFAAAGLREGFGDG